MAQLANEDLKGLDCVAVQDVLDGDWDLDGNSVALDETEQTGQAIEDVLGDFDGVAVQDMLKGDRGDDVDAVTTLAAS